jgi:hypothetical protein
MHMGASPDGTSPYLELVELEEPISGPWWDPVRRHAELIMPLERATHLGRAIDSFLRLSRNREERAKARASR